MEIWDDIVTAFKAGEMDVETFVVKCKTIIEAEIGGLPGLIKNIISTDANQIASTYESEFQQIVTNLQNTLPGLTLETAIPLFIAAATPVIVSEAKTLLATDWNLISTYFLTNAGITSSQGNGGVLQGGSTSTSTSSTVTTTTITNTPSA